MLEKSNNNEVSPIPDKRYFAIGEVSEICGVKPHVLRYWEQEFAELSQIKRRGNRRYYQPHQVLLIRQIKDFLYAQGFTIGGAKSYLTKDLNKENQLVSIVLIKDIIIELEAIKFLL